MTEPVPQLEPFYITFGSQYSYETHPFYEDAHPDGWVVIWAYDEDEARHFAFSLFASRWGFIYSEENFNRHYYPRGELAVVEAG